MSAQLGGFVRSAFGYRDLMSAQLGGFIRDVLGPENCWTFSSGRSLRNTSVKCTISNIHQNTNFATSNRASERERERTKNEDVQRARRKRGSEETEN